MKKRKIELKTIGKNIYRGGKVSVYQEEGGYFFEIGKELTSDIGEAVAILLRSVDFSDSIWDLCVDDIDLGEISPDKSLFWLTGGYVEWRVLDNYSKPWSESMVDFVEEYGETVRLIIKRSKKLSDIRDGFVKYLNLPTLYEFALSKNLIKI